MTTERTEAESTKTKAVKPKVKKAKSVAEPIEVQQVAKKVAAKKVASKEVVEAEPVVESPVAKKKATKKAATKEVIFAEVAKAEETAPEVEAQSSQAELADQETGEAPAKKMSTKTSSGTKTAAKKVAAKKAAEVEPEVEEEAAGGPEPKLERLQKILARAGISSRRKAEELILGGQVQINGKIVTELGSKADPARDHVRVDGKLLQGPERIRYFVLNKPKGFVTTVSDPEGRPTVMQFFERENERLYPVGRLDYLSEGLLLVTNDGDLANKLTKASSGVEKTYLVKVAGQPTEDMLDVLRAGVVIEKGRPGTGSGRVRTAPAQIRQVRQGDNPWYEVIIIEGRNRELRKMFEEIGHHVEKIRRVGYGPLVLDLEPGKLRELEPEEVQQLRLAAAGKLKTRRRRGPASAQLPREAGKTVRFKKADGKPGYKKPETYGIPVKDRPVVPRPGLERPMQAGPSSGGFASGSGRPASVGAGFSKPPYAKPAFDKPGFSKPAFGKPRFEKSGTDRPRFDRGGPSKPAFGKGGFNAKPRSSEPPVIDYVVPRKPVPEFDEASESGRGGFNPDYKPGFRTGGKPGFAGGAAKRFGGDSGPRGGSRASFDRDKPYQAHSSGPRSERPAPFRSAPRSDDEGSMPVEPRKPIRIGIEPVMERPRDARSDRDGRQDRPSRPAGGKPFGKPFQARGEGFAGGVQPFRPAGGRFQGDRPAGGRPSGDRPSGSRPPAGDKPFRPRTDRQDRPDVPARPFRPRADGPPSGERGERPFRPRTDRPGAPAGGSRPFRPRMDGAPSGERPAFGRGAGAGSSRLGSSRPGQFRPDSGRPGQDSRPPRFAPRTDGPPARRPKSFEGASDAPREFRPRDTKSFGGPKKFGAGKSFGARKFDSPKPAPGGSNSKPSGKLGPDGLPRVKVRARDSFTGKNKGRPKPRPKSEE
jgi:23S rRNA pseudouridine2605 synthase